MTILSGVEEKAAEEAGAADESKEKEEVGIVQEAEKPIGKAECFRL